MFYRANQQVRGTQSARFRPKIRPERESGDNFTPETRTGGGGGAAGARKVATRRPSGKEALFSRTRSFASPARTHDTNTNRNRFPGLGEAYRIFSPPKPPTGFHMIAYGFHMVSHCFFYDFA